MCRERSLPIMILPLLMLSSAVLADDAALVRCRVIPDAISRLACYDALPIAGVEDKTGPGQPGQPLLEMFGKEDSIPPAAGLPAVETNIPGHFEGCGPNTRFRLANGQVWQVADGSDRVYDAENPKVTITRGALGSFYLSLAGDNRTVRVRRIQ
jgi:hypothetical protein